MPRIRCSNCSQTYDVPPHVAVRLPMSIATCSCGEWMCGSKEQILTRFSTDGKIEEIDMSGYRIDAPPPEPETRKADPDEGLDAFPPKSVRIIARGADASINRVYTIDREPLWIGRQGCHVELDDAELSIRHWSWFRITQNEVYFACRAILASLACRAGFSTAP